MRIEMTSSLESILMEILIRNFRNQQWSTLTRVFWASNLNQPTIRIKWIEIMIARPLTTKWLKLRTLYLTMNFNREAMTTIWTRWRWSRDRKIRCSGKMASLGKTKQIRWKWRTRHMAWPSKERAKRIKWRSNKVKALKTTRTLLLRAKVTTALTVTLLLQQTIPMLNPQPTERIQRVHSRALQPIKGSKYLPLTRAKSKAR